jgi:hypothetical protein
MLLRRLGYVGLWEMPADRGVLAACFRCEPADSASAGTANAGFHRGRGDAAFSAVLRCRQGLAAGIGSPDRPARD